jgi:DNA repair protein RadD
MVGRGFRLHPSKTDCLVLDFGGNILRHGPVDSLQIKDKSTGTGEAPAKECPKCHLVIHAAYSLCPECGYEFPAPERQKHDTSASTAGVLSGQVEDTEYKVYDTAYHFHLKKDAGPDTPPTLRVEYNIGFRHWQSEWICFEHTGYARAKAEGWWRARSNEPVPDTVEEALALAQAGALAETEQITVRSVSGQKYDRIINYQLGPKPPLLDGSDERDDETLPEYSWAEDDIPF